MAQDLYTYFEEGMKAVKKLIGKGDLLNADRGAQELLKIDPYNEKLLKLLRKIENKILKRNIKGVKKEIKRTWHLWDEKRYEELLNIYERLLDYAPQYEKLHELIRKVEQMVGKEELEKRRRFIADAINAISKIFKEKKWPDVIQACEELLRLDPRNNDAKNFLQKAKHNFVGQELDVNDKLIDSADFERQVELFNRLLKIEPKNSRVLSLYADTKKKLSEKQRLENKILVNEGEKRIKKLFDAQEYEKTLQATEEVKMLEPKNFIANIYERKAWTTLETEISQKARKISLEAMMKLREEFKKNPKAFVKI